MGENMNGKYLGWVVALGTLVVSGALAFGLKSPLEEKLKEMHIPSRAEEMKAYNFRTRVLGIMYPKMLDGDTIGNFWIDENKAPERIRECDSLSGECSINVERVAEDLRKFYPLR